MENWVRIPILISFDCILEGSRIDKLTKVIMEALSIGGGMPRNHVATKLICFGGDNVNVFQSTKFGVTKHIHNDYRFNSIRMHYMAHWMNLVVQTLLVFPLVKHIENLFIQTLQAYFAHYTKRHLEFTKLTKIMEIKGNKILHNVKTRWISMLSLAKRMMVEYKTLLVKMVMDQNTNQQSKFNYKHLCDLQILLGLACIFPLLKSMHVLIKFAQMWDIFVYDLVATIKICQDDFYNMYFD